jgi:hypothetical protein
MVVRNPYDKLVSSFFYWTRQDKASTTQTNNTNSIWHWNTRGKFLDENMSFVEFVYWYDKQREYYKDLLLTSTEHPLIPFYVRSLSEGYTVSKSSNFLRLEFLNQDLQKMGLHIDHIPHYNITNKRTNTDFYLMFTPEILNIANKWCAEDAIQFGYDVLKTEDLTCLLTG